MKATLSRMVIASLVVTGLVSVSVTSAEAQGRKGVKAATGPFTYDPASGGPTTFLGHEGAANADFQLCPPGGGTIFPAGSPTADADIRVFGIQHVGDADGNPLAVPEPVALDSTLGAQIAGAFDISPNAPTVYPGGCLDVEIAISNPGVGPFDYGDYEVTVKAQAVGSGIGVGSGFRYLLKLRPAPANDTTPPDVTIDSPANGSTNILGVIPVQITANDPAPGTGVQTISATISSAGGTVSNHPITFDSNSAPQPAGSDAVAIGSFTPTGGTGTDGTTSGGAFTSAARSGIGTYTLSAEAIDGASNVGTASSTFQVKYDVQFTLQTGIINTGNPGNSNGHFKFTAKRSNVTSDGAFVYDNTVVVRLIRASDDAVIATHVLGGGGGVFDKVVYTADPSYETKFAREDIGATTSGSYKVKVLFLDVDNNLVEQAESITVTF
jgi:hypothetical protein